jgi:hypothetical protein
MTPSKSNALRLGAMFCLTILSSGTASFSAWSINHGFLIGNLVAAFLFPIIGAAAMSFYITAPTWADRMRLAVISGMAHCIGSTATLLLMRGR